MDPILVGPYHLVGAKILLMPDNLLCCFLEIQLKKLDETVCFCNRLLAAKYPKIQFKVDSLLSCLLRVNTTLVHYLVAFLILQ